MTTRQYDPITSNIIQNSIQAAADEMFAAFRHTAMSAIIYEVLDMGVGITDKNGELASSGAGIPAFAGLLDKSVFCIIKKFNKPGDIMPGDIFITNDPYSGGVTHLNDVVLAMPIFVDGEMVAWAANMAHYNDVGGAVPGSMSSDATEIFQEGFILSAIKLFSEGKSLLVYPVKIEPGTTFRTALAVAPQAWTAEGDGVVFSVYVEDEAGIHLVYSRYVDPKHHDLDRAWLLISINLDDFKGKLVRLLLEVNSGPAGDDRYDWAGWSEARLERPRLP